MTKMHRPLLLAAPVLALAAVLGGCASNKSPESYEAIAGDLTPDMDGLSERPIDINRNLAMMAEQNGRSFWNDLGRVFYTDHPSRLTPYPMTSLSGQPR